MKVIKYYEDNQWKYATVKGVGDTDQLLTSTKTSLVDAINEIVTNGTSITMEKLPQELVDEINNLTTNTNNLTTSQSNLDEKQRQLDSSLSSLNLQIGTFTQEDYNAMIASIQSNVNALSAKEQSDYNTFNTAMETQATNTQDALSKKLDILQYQTEQEAINNSLASKVDISTYDGFVNETNTSVTNINNTLSSKVDSVYFNEQFGLNAWLLKTYIYTDSSITVNTPLEFNTIKDEFLSDTNEISDNSTLVLEGNNNQLSYLSTNVYVEIAKNVTLKCSYHDSLTVYLNGALIHQGYNSDGALKDVVISLKKGWNTVNILHYQLSNTTGLLSLGVILNSLVDRMSYITSLDDTYKLEKMSTEIQQNKDSIALSASKITNIEGNISDHETRIQENADAIILSAKKTDLDAVTQRMTDAEASIQINADNIASKVNKTDFDILNGKVSSDETTITQLSDSIELKANSSDVTALGTRMTDAESSIKVNSDNIALKANKTDVDTISGRVTNAESAIQVNSDNIALKASKTDVDNLTGRMVDAESAIQLNSDNIALTAKKTDLDTLTERMTVAEGSITVNTNSITQKVDQTTFNSLSGRVLTAESKIEANTQGISLNYTELKGDISNISTSIRNLLKKTDLTTGVSQSSNTNGFSTSVWGGNIVDNTHLLQILKPDTEYAISYKFRLDTLSANTITYNQNAHGTLLLYSGVSGYSLIYLRDNVDTVAEANSWQVGDIVERKVVFRTPANLTDSGANYRIIGYTRRSMQSDGTTFVANETGTFFDVMLVEGNTIPVTWTPAPEDVDSKLTELDARLTITEGGILTEVEKNGLLSVVTQTESTWQVDASKIVLNGETLITDAKINSAFIKNLDASVITSGTIDANVINVINLSADQILANGISADKITGGTLRGVTLDITDGTAGMYGGFHVKSDGSINIGNYFSVDKYGNMSSTSGVFSGNISGATVTGSTINSVSSSDSRMFTNISGGSVRVDGWFLRNMYNDSYTGYVNRYYPAFVEVDKGYVRVSTSGKYTDANMTNSITTAGRSIYFTDKGLSTKLEDFNNSSTAEISSSRYIDFWADETGNSGYTGSGMYVFSGQDLTVQGNGMLNLTGVRGIIMESDSTVNVMSSGFYYNGDGIATRAWVNGNGYLTSIPSSISPNTVSCNYLNLGTSLAYSGGYLKAPTGSLSISQNTVKANTITQLSNADYKKNIVNWDEDALAMINDTPIKQYQYKSELDEEFPHVGIIVQEAPVWAISIDGDGVEPYSMASMAWKAIQQEDTKVEALKTENSALKARVDNIEAILKANGLMQ